MNDHIYIGPSILSSQGVNYIRKQEYNVNLVKVRLSNIRLGRIVGNISHNIHETNSWKCPIQTLWLGHI